MRCSIVVTVALWWFLAGALHNGCASPTEPAASWVYPYLYELRIRHPGPPLLVSTGPYERSRIARWVDGFGTEPDTLGRRSLWLHRMLRRELSAELVPRSGDMTAAGDVLLSSVLETDQKPKSEAFLRAALYSGQSVCVWTTLRSTLNGPEYHKTETRVWQERGRASFDQGGINYRKGAFSIFVGRDELSWGADRQRGLLFSGSANNMDMLKIALGSDRFRFVSFQSRLRRGEDEQWPESMRRFVSGHRLEVLVRPSLSLSISEAVIYGGENRAFEWVYLNPLTALYAEQWNSEYEDNVLIAGDFAWLIPKRAEVRGELMVDDFQYDFSTEPHEFAAGLTLAAVNPMHPEASMFGGSYYHVRNRTYGHYVDWNRFVFEGKVIGYPDGPDGDKLRLWISLALPDAMFWKLDYVYRRRGESRATDTLERVGSKVRFPSGVVETLRALGLDVSWRPYFEWMFNGRIEWYRLENQENIEASDDTGVRFRFGATYNLKWSSRL